MHKNFYKAQPFFVMPFLKWAGGKRWLVEANVKYSPDNFRNYFEPFLGSASVFFSLPIERAILSDVNSELVGAYEAIKNDWEKVENCLRKHASRHCDEYYYQIRSSRPKKEHTKAARFIYLNRTCWNGLYRVNLKGEFNVPRGTKNSVILPSDDFEKLSKRLSSCEILCQDFESTISAADKGDFVFVDPPYTVNHNLNGFLKYNERIFSWNDQVRLRDALVEAQKRGVKITVTNADHQSIRQLYKGLGQIVRLERASIIAARAEDRRSTTEIMVRMGWTV